MPTGGDTSGDTYQRPTPERLRQGVGHLQYECVSFYRQGGLLIESRSKPTPAGVAQDAWEVLKIAVLEAWLVHARCLMMAFRARRGRGFPDDVLFRDYLSAGAWGALRDELVPDAAAEERVNDIGLFLAHISYGRADNPLRARWHVEEYVRLDTRIRKWYDALDPEWQHEFRPLAEVLGKAPPRV